MVKGQEHAENIRNFERGWAQLIVRSWIDEDFKKRLLSNPKAIFKEGLIKFNENVTYKVYENTPEVIHLVLLKDLSKEMSESEIKTFFQQTYIRDRTMYGEEWGQGNDDEYWAKITEKAWKDAAFKQKLISDPKKVLEEFGCKPKNLKYVVLENTDSLINLTIPLKPEDILTEETLKKVAGGWWTGGASSSVCSGISG